MTDLSKDTVEQVARLARLELDQDEIEYYRSQLSKVVSYFSEIDEAQDSLGESWRFDIEGMALPERVDIVELDDSYKLVLGDAPKAVGSSFQVPRIIE